jgi:hypothetical protein
MLAVALAVTGCQAGLSIYFTISGGGGGEVSGRSSDYRWAGGASNDRPAQTCRPKSWL